MPLIAIEVVITSPLVDKLAVYAGLGVPEVWTYFPDRRTITVHRLVGGSYEARDRSEALPAMNLALLASFVRPGESHTALVKAYRAAIR